MRKKRSLSLNPPRLALGPQELVAVMDYTSKTRVRELSYSTFKINIRYYRVLKTFLKQKTFTNIRHPSSIPTNAHERHKPRSPFSREEG